MSYSYAEEKKELFTDEGQRMLLKIRDRVQQLLREAGAVRMDKAMAGIGRGSSWTMLACVDRLVELGEIREVTQERCAGQFRVFVSTKHD